MKNIEKLQELLDSVVNQQYGSLKLPSGDHLHWSLGELDSGFRIVNKTNTLLFGASTDGTETKIYPLGIMNRSENADFIRWVKAWRLNGLKHHQDKLESVFEQVENTSE